MSEALSSLKRSLREIRKSGDLEVHERVDLRAWTTLRVGGVADLVVRCHSIEAVQATIDLMAAHGSRWVVLGSGSALVPADLGLRTPAIALSGQLCRWERDEDGVVAGAGANLTQLSRSLAHGVLAALGEMPSGRASLGGAIAGARTDADASVRRLLDWVEVAKPGVPLQRVALSTSEDIFSWSGFNIHRSVIVRGRLVGDHEHGDPDRSANRERVPPMGWQLGPRIITDVFIDPGEERAEHLLEQAACRGLSHGGARVSGESANALRSSRTCSASDVLGLVRRMKSRVWRRSGVELETRVVFLDEHGGIVSP